MLAHPFCAFLPSVGTLVSPIEGLKQWQQYYNVKQDHLVGTLVSPIEGLKLSDIAWATGLVTSSERL